VKFLDKSEDVAVIFTKQLLQVFSALCLHLLLGHGACACKVFVDLVVEILPVGHDNEREIAWNFSKHFLGEKDHGVALPASLRVPENSEAASILFDLLQCLSSIVHTKVLSYRYRDFSILSIVLVAGCVREAPDHSVLLVHWRKEMLQGVGRSGVRI